MLLIVKAAFVLSVKICVLSVVGVSVANCILPQAKLIILFCSNALLTLRYAV
jgi:hypothetical protein